MSPSNPTPQTGGGPTLAEAKEAARRGVTVYQLRLEQGGKAGRKPRAPKVLRIPDVPLAQLTRDGDSLAGTIWVAPRTKKNKQSIAWRTLGGKTTPFIRSSETSRGFAQAVMAAILPHKARLRLPLPDRDYAFSAVYYVDNQACDVVGLQQALQDALEGAHVVTNDNQFNPIERQLRVFQPSDPRVTFTITPASP